MILIGIGIAAGVLLVLALIAFKFYVVVEPNKAHVVVMLGKGRRIYHPSNPESKSAYFYVPGLMQRIIVSLENVKHEINEVELRDKSFAPFKCDITCWFKITNSDLAAEKLDVDDDGNIMSSIRETLDAQVQGVVRATAMQQEVLELMQDRKTFGENVFKEVNGSLDEWGIQLVKLEIIDFSDANNSRVIQDYEARREADISSTTRQQVAEREQEARVKEAETQKIAETAKIQAQQEIELRDIERKQLVGVRDEAARLNVAKQTDLANAQQIAAERTKTVGQAQYTADASVVKAEGDAQATVKKATGDKQAKIEIAQGEAKAIEVQGLAEAGVIEATGTAKAIATKKSAEAQKEFQDASKEIEMAKIAADVQKTQYQSMADAMQKADIQIVSPDMSFMGFGAKEGAGLGVMLETLQKTSGVNLAQIVSGFTQKDEPQKTESK